MYVLNINTQEVKRQTPAGTMKKQQNEKPDTHVSGAVGVFILPSFLEQ